MSKCNPVTAKGKFDQKIENIQILKYQMKPKGVTNQMKDLNKYILMVLFTLLQGRVHSFAFLSLI